MSEEASTILEQAISLAVEAHRGQKDRSGEPYILHPLRVMCRVQTPEEKMTAILHDTVEDTELTLDQLRARGFPEAVVQAVDCLTKREGEPYENLIRRASGNRIARKVKLADLEDNMDVRRNTSLGEKDLARYNKYLRAWRELSGAQ